MGEAPDSRRMDLALWFSWPGGVELHPALSSRQMSLYSVCDAAERIADTQIAPGLRLWEKANWLERVWVEVYVRPDEVWRPEYYTQPRAEVYGGKALILPLLVDLAEVVDRSDDELVAMLVAAAPRLIDAVASRRKWGTVPWDGIAPEGGIQTTREPLSPAKKHGALERLWATLEAAGAAPDRPALETIAAVGDGLHRRGKTACQEFNTGMHLALHDLDREVLFRQPVRDRGEDVSNPVIPLSEDTFLYVRAAVVLSGKSAFDRVLADPAQLTARPWDMDAEELLVLPETVLEALGTELQPPPGIPSYETGSNKAFWPHHA